MQKSVACLVFMVLGGGLALAQTEAPATPAPATTANANKVPDPSDQTWSSVYGRCREAVRNVDVKDMQPVCQQALDLAQKAGEQTPHDQVALVQTWETYGQALLAVGRGTDALAAENKAVDLAKSHFQVSDQEYAMPFYWRALVESHFHDGASASGDLTLAENSYRRAMVASPRLRRVYGQYLARILRQHAELLDAMGQSTDANKLRTEAASL